jgi:nucleoside-diphosphate-sugar epimerase
VKRILVTGAAGFVGANLVRRLLSDGHQVHVLVKPGSDLWRLEEIRSDVRIHETNLADEHRTRQMVGTIRPEWLFHLAAYGGSASHTDAHGMVRTNVLGTSNLVHAALDVGFDAFVNTGSSSEYGFKNHGPKESEGLEPSSEYAITKASATLLCRCIARRHHAPIQTLRLYSVYGPYEEPNRLMPTLIVHGLSGGLPPLVRAEIARDFVHVADVVDAYLLAAQCLDQEPGTIYNVGTGVQTSIGQLVELARRHLGVTAEPRWASMPDRVWDTTVWVADRVKIGNRLGWKPVHTVPTGFCQMVRWLLENHQYRARYMERQPMPTGPGHVRR